MFERIKALIASIGQAEQPTPSGAEEVYILPPYDWPGAPSWEQIDAAMTVQEEHDAKEPHVKAIAEVIFKSQFSPQIPQGIAEVILSLRKLGPAKTVSLLVSLDAIELETFKKRLSEFVVPDESSES